MKLLIVSDLHLEFGKTYSPPPVSAFDVVVLAGDIHRPGRKAVAWATKMFGGRPVILVAGNHEFYGCGLQTELQAMKTAATGTPVHVLDRSAIEIDGVRFLGSVLWTDFALAVSAPNGQSGRSDVNQAMAEAGRALSDFQRITFTDEENGFQRRPLTPEDTLALHLQDRDWLASALGQRTAQSASSLPTVVVTHHAPTSGSVAPEFAADWLTPAFASQLPASFFEVPRLWIHGHTHSSFDYHVSSCRVVANPRGYPLRQGAFENRDFNAQFVVDLDT